MKPGPKPRTLLQKARARVEAKYSEHEKTCSICREGRLKGSRVLCYEGFGIITDLYYAYGVARAEARFARRLQ